MYKFFYKQAIFEKNFNHRENEIQKMRGGVPGYWHTPSRG